MKNFLLSIFIFSLVFAGISFAVAYEGVDNEAQLEITFEDLGLGEPKLLPGEPLYFLKNWQRGVRRFFSFGNLRKAVFETKLMNKLAAEVKASGEELDDKGLSLALQNYKESARRLEERISSLDETSENPKVDGLLNMLAVGLVKHEQVFEEIESSEIGKESEEARESLEEAAAGAINKLDMPGSFKVRVENLTSELEDNSLKELRVVYALNRIEEKMSDEFRGRIRELETDLISGFEGRFKAEPEEVVPHLNFLPLESADNLSIFDEIRERITDGGLKSELNVVRQNVLRNGNGGIVEKETLLNIIHETEDAVDELKKRISSDEYISSKSVEELLERAEFHLVQATKLLGEGQDGTAFGQATAAQAAAQNGLSQLRLKSELKEENFSLRVKFDDLVRFAKSRNLIRASASEIYELFDRAERAVLEADTAAELRDAKIMLAELEVLIINSKER
jgi:hypothetical protein